MIKKSKKSVFLNICCLFSFAYFSITKAPNVVLVSIPKAGTHLLLKCIQLLTGKPYQNTDPNFFHFKPHHIETLNETHVLCGHFIATKEHINCLAQNKTKVLFIIRDPRSQLISQAYWIKKLKPFWKEISTATLEEIITNLISNPAYVFLLNPHYQFDEIKNLKNLANFYDLYIPWINQPFVYATTFEKLVGPNGGGSREQQIQEIRNIAHHIGLQNISEEKINYVAKNLFGNTPTFSIGKTKSWQQHFTPEIKTLFKQTTGDLLVKLGYEHDNNW